MSRVGNRKGKIVIPRFDSPRAEAAWFDKNRKRLEADMSRRLQAGDTKTLAEVLQQSATKEKARLKSVTIRMRRDDLDLVRRLALEQGVPYQSFLQGLLRQALQKHSASVSLR